MQIFCVKGTKDKDLRFTAEATKLVLDRMQVTVLGVEVPEELQGLAFDMAFHHQDTCSAVSLVLAGKMPETG